MLLLMFAHIVSALDGSIFQTLNIPIPSFGDLNETAAGIVDKFGFEDCADKWFTDFSNGDHFKELKKGEHFCFVGPAMIAGNASFKISSKYINFNAKGEAKFEVVEKSNPLVIAAKTNEDSSKQPNIVTKVQCDDGVESCDIQFTYILQPIKFKASFETAEILTFGKVAASIDVDYKTIVTTKKSYSTTLDNELFANFTTKPLQARAVYKGGLLIALGPQEKEITIKKSTEQYTAKTATENGLTNHGKVIVLIPVPKPKVETEIFPPTVQISAKSSFDIEISEKKSSSDESKNYYPEDVTYSVSANAGVQTKKELEDSQESEKSGLKPGYIALIVIACLVIVAVIVIGVVIILKKKKSSDSA